VQNLHYTYDDFEDKDYSKYQNNEKKNNQFKIIKILSGKTKI
tara:strand:+ start:2659 stop:2784 length:126 start_codon:yes stop_codon:yes gene_type:complete